MLERQGYTRNQAEPRPAMPPAALVLIALLNQGHWIGGQPGEINLQWSAKSDLPAAVVEWQLQYGDTQLGTGRVALKSGAKQATLTITPPPVRALCEVECSFNVKAADTGKTIIKTRTTLHIYPADLLAKVGARLGAKSLAVWDRADGLPAILKDAKIPFTRLDDESNLQFTKYDILVVSQDQLRERPFGQASLLGHVQNGTSLLVLRQIRVKTVAGYALQRRTVPAKLTWREGAGLLAHLRTRELSTGEDAWAIQLPADEPALELVYWPREVRSAEPAPIDALLVSKTLGQGRVVLCQIPLGNWKQDPLAQLFLADALEYLSSRPEPTPPPSRRPPPPTPPPSPRVPQLLDPVKVSP